MEINIIQLIVIIVLAACAWYANEKLNPIPVAKNVVSVVIVLVTVLLVLQSMGLINTGARITVGP